MQHVSIIIITIHVKSEGVYTSYVLLSLVISFVVGSGGSGLVFSAIAPLLSLPVSVERPSIKSPGLILNSSSSFMMSEILGKIPTLSSGFILILSASGFCINIIVLFSLLLLISLTYKRATHGSICTNGNSRFAEDCVSLHDRMMSNFKQEAVYRC